MDLGVQALNNSTSARAQIITRRTYCRPKNVEGTEFESWEEVINRVIEHQQWLWERALTHKLMPEMPLHDITNDLSEWVSLSVEQHEELEELRQLMLDRKVAVSGRTFWLGGTDIGKQIEASQFNCAALNIETVYDIVDAFWLLLNGAGVGFRPVTGNLTGFTSPIKELQIIRSKGSTIKGRETNLEEWDCISKTWSISVGDSAIAWAKFIGKLLAGKYRANKLILDFSEIRSAGLRLKNYGWISQGDKGLASSSEKIFNILNKRADSLLNATDILDITNLLGTILSTRRSAQIAVYNYEDPEWEDFASFKNNMFENGNSHRTQSNNSLFFSSRPKKKVLKELFDQVIVGGGEPGIINGETMRRRSPWASLTNPCVTADTLVSTSEGLRSVKSLINVPFEARVDDGDYKCNTGFFSTGTKEVLKIKVQSGQYLRVTGNHKIMTKEHGWVEAQNLNIGDHLVISKGWANSSVINEKEFDLGWILGEIIGDGGYNPDKYSGYVRFWGDSAKAMYTRTYDIIEKYYPESLARSKRDKLDNNGIYTFSNKVLDDLADTFIEKASKDFKDTIFQASESFIRGVISGFFDADGSVQGNLVKGVSIRLGQSCLKKLEVIQQLLLSLGIHSTVYSNRNPAGFRELPDGRGGHKEYMCKDAHELVVSRKSFTIFGKDIGFKEPSKQERFNLIESSRKRAAYADSIFTKITSIEPDGVEEVFDCTVDTVHKFAANGLVVHNCGEILLPASGGFCCLTTINLSKFQNNILELLKAAKLITRANYRQTVVDFRDGILQEKWHLNNEHLHLCGVSLMGIVDSPLQPYDYTRLERTITTAGYNMASELSKPYPKQLTTLKPEGTISKCYDSTEGMHKPLGKYIFNNVAFSVHDPLVGILKGANYRVFTHPYDPTAMLVTLPVKYDNVAFDKAGDKDVNFESALKQLERYKMLMQYYCHQNVSCTISYDPSEAKDIVNWIYNNWDNYVAVSFLLRNDPSKTAQDLGYPYLPQEVVDKHTYEEYITLLKPVDLNSSQVDDTILESDCAGGSCPIR